MAHVPPLDACACQKGEQSPQQRQREVTRVFQSNGRDQANEKTGLFTSGVLRDKNKARSIKRQKQGKLTVSFSFEIKLFFFFFLLATPHSLQDLSCLTRDWTRAQQRKCGVLSTRPPGHFQYNILLIAKMVPSYSFWPAPLGLILTL